jgi:hypothetical protein
MLSDSNRIQSTWDKTWTQVICWRSVTIQRLGTVCYGILYGRIEGLTGFSIKRQQMH